MAALHVGSERLLAGFDDWKWSHTLDALRGRRIRRRLKLLKISCDICDGSTMRGNDGHDTQAGRVTVPPSDP